MLTLQQIINEADVLVINPFTPETKVGWLQGVNGVFFDAVKIPIITTFTAVKGTAVYTLDTDIRAKNIDRVTVGASRYASGMADDVRAGRALWMFDDATHKLTLSPAPIQSDSGRVRYFMIGTTTFDADTLTAEPDAPAEYHHVYVDGLCERIAQALDDAVKANNYGTAFRNGLSMAAQQYRGDRS